MDRGARHSPETEPNEAIRWHPECEAKGKQPGIDIATARNIAHALIESRDIIETAAKFSPNEPFRPACEQISDKEDEPYRISGGNLTASVKMIRQSRPP